jgi:hypothetical protein
MKKLAIQPMGKEHPIVPHVETWLKFNRRTIVLTVKRSIISFSEKNPLIG